MPPLCKLNTFRTFDLQAAWSFNRATFKRSTSGHARKVTARKQKTDRKR